MLLEITQDHIDRAEALRRNAWDGSWDICASCPTALALKDLTYTERVSVNNSSALVGAVAMHVSAPLLREVIHKFNMRDDPKPGTYELTPYKFEHGFWER